MLKEKTKMPKIILSSKPKKMLWKKIRLGNNRIKLGMIFRKDLRLKKINKNHREKYKLNQPLN